MDNIQYISYIIGTKLILCVWDFIYHCHQSKTRETTSEQKLLTHFKKEIDLFLEKYSEQSGNYIINVQDSSSLLYKKLSKDDYKIITVATYELDNRLPNVVKNVMQEFDTSDLTSILDSCGIYEPWKCIRMPGCCTFPSNIQRGKLEQALSKLNICIYIYNEIDIFLVDMDDDVFTKIANALNTSNKPIDWSQIESILPFIDSEQLIGQDIPEMYKKLVEYLVVNHGFKK